jgi:Chaperone of endosialidase
MTISGTIEQAPTDAYCFTDVLSNDIVFRAFANANFVFGSGSNVVSTMRVNSNTVGFNASGVGVGTNSPQGTMHVFNSNSAPVFILDGNGINNRGALRFLPTNAGNYIQSGVVLSNDSKADIAFASMMGTTEWVRIKAATGSVGIGTNNPAYSLDVVGNARFSSGVVTTNIAVSNITASSCNLSIGCDGATKTINIGCGSNAQVVNIGTTSSAGTIVNIGGVGDTVNISGTVQSVAMTNSTTSNKLITVNQGGAAGTAAGVGIQFQENNIATGYIKTSTDRNGFLFRSPAGTSDMVMNLSSGAVNLNNNAFVISSNGNVGLNTIAPAYKLDVSGPARATSILIGNGSNDNGSRLVSALDASMTTSNTRYITLGRSAATNDQTEWAYNHVADGSSSNYGSFGLNGSVALTWNGRANVGIGTTSATSPLHVASTSTTHLLLHNTSAGTSNVAAIDFKPHAAETNPAGRVAVIDDGAYGGHLTLSTKAASGTGSDTGSDTNTVTERLRIVNSGNIGIGTMYPTQKVDIFGGLALRNGNTPANPANSQIHFAYSNSDNYKHVLKTRHASSDSSSNAIDFYVWQTSQGITEIGNKHVLSVTSRGVGVSTTDPKYNLDVNGSINASSLYVNGAAVNASTFWQQGMGVNWSPSNVVIGAASNTSYALDVGGQVHVSGATSINGTVQGAYVNWNNSTGDGRTQLINSRGGGLGGFLFDLYTTAGFSNTAMMVDGNANVGINTTTPMEKLHVNNGSIYLGNAGTDTYVKSPGQMHLWANNSGASTYNNMIYSVGSNGSTGSHTFFTQGDSALGNGVERMRIASNGYVGIGNTSPQYPLDVTGQAHASSFPTSSDARFKTNIQVIPGALDKLCSLQGVTFDWEEHYPAYEQFVHPETLEPIRQIGLIAQHVKVACPELVTHWKANLPGGGSIDDAHAVDYGRMAALYVEAFKEMKNEIDTLKGQVAALLGAR